MSLVELITRAAGEAPAVAAYRDPRDGRRAALSLSRDERGYTIALSTAPGCADDGMEARMRFPSTEARAMHVARLGASIARAGYRLESISAPLGDQPLS